jgi:hypothetical protein
MYLPKVLGALYSQTSIAQGLATSMRVEERSAGAPSVNLNRVRPDIGWATSKRKELKVEAKLNNAWV